MTRNEEKRAVSFDKYAWSPAYRHAFEEGVEWADKTLTKKACEWLKDNLPNWVDSYKEDIIIEEFRKAMER